MRVLRGVEKVVQELASVFQGAEVTWVGIPPWDPTMSDRKPLRNQPLYSPGAALAIDLGFRVRAS